MKNFVFAALAATAVFAATPAMAGNAASFDGFRVGATAGYDDVTGAIDANDVVYGADLGVDFAVSDNVVFGVEGTVTNVFEDSRTLGVGARLGYAVNENLLPYVRAGYSNYRDVTNLRQENLDGLTVGGGLEYTVTNNTYIKAEYRYSDFENGVGNHGALVGVGIRF